MDKDKKTLENLLETIKQFNQDRDWDQFHNPKDLAIGMVTESAELLDLFRFVSADKLEALMVDKQEAIEEEVMDVLYFVLRFAQMNHINIYDAFERKMAKNEKKYPVESVRGKHHKYTEYKK